MTGVPNVMTIVPTAASVTIPDPINTPFNRVELLVLARRQHDHVCKLLHALDLRHALIDVLPLGPHYLHLICPRTSR
jgi:hypothetical protein